MAKPTTFDKALCLADFYHKALEASLICLREASKRRVELTVSSCILSGLVHAASKSDLFQQDAQAFSDAMFEGFSKVVDYWENPNGSEFDKFVQIIKKDS